MKNPMRQLPDPSSITPPNTYIGMRYVPIYGGEWDETKVYENLVMVSYENNIYLSHKPVPAGINPTSPDYWVHMYATPSTPGPEPTTGFPWDWSPGESIGMLPNNPDINASELFTNELSNGIVIPSGTFYFYSDVAINVPLLFSPGTHFEINKGVKLEFNTAPIIVDYQPHFTWGNAGTTINRESGVHLPPMSFRSNWFIGSFSVWVKNGSYHLYHEKTSHISVTVGKKCNLVIEGSGLPTIQVNESSTVEFKGFTFIPNIYPVLTVTSTPVGSPFHSPTIRLTDVTISETSEDHPYFKVSEGNDVTFIIRNMRLRGILHSPIIWHNVITGSRLSSIIFDIDGITGESSSGGLLYFPLPVSTTANIPNWTADLNGYPGTYRNCALTVPHTSDNPNQKLIWNMTTNYLFENARLSEQFTGATGRSVTVTAINSVFGSEEGFFNRVISNNVTMIDCNERTPSNGVGRLPNNSNDLMFQIVLPGSNTTLLNVPFPYAHFSASNSPTIAKFKIGNLQANDIQICKFMTPKNTSNPGFQAWDCSVTNTADGFISATLDNPSYTHMANSAVGLLIVVTSRQVYSKPILYAYW